MKMWSMKLWNHLTSPAQKQSDKFYQTKYLQTQLKAKHHSAFKKYFNSLEILKYLFGKQNPFKVDEPACVSIKKAK